MLPACTDAALVDLTAQQPIYHENESGYKGVESVWEGETSSDEESESWSDAEPAAVGPAGPAGPAAVEPGSPADEAVQLHGRHRGRAARYMPRRRDHGELRGVVDCNIDRLWEPSLSDREHPPPPEALYNSFKEALDGVQAWAADHGVAYNKKDARGVQKTRVLMCCNRSGKRPERKNGEPPRQRKGATSQKTGCKMGFWLLAENYLEPTGQWRVKLMEGRKSFTHNHPPVSDKFSFVRYRRVTWEAVPEERLRAIWAAARGPNQALQIVRAEFPFVRMTRQDIKNRFLVFHRQELGLDTHVGVLLKGMEREKYWFQHAIDSENHLTHLVFIHPRCLANFKKSPDALIVDCTYKTNKYNYPLLNLVGSDGFNHTIHLGVALLRNQDEAAYTWVLLHLKRLFEEHNITVRIWLTDRDLAFINALKTVFDQPPIILCRWHVNKDVEAYLQLKLSTEFGRERVNGQWRSRQATNEYFKLFQQLLSSPSEADYKENLEACRQRSNVATAYLESTWLNYHATKLVSCFVDRHTHFGLTVTSKAEGAHRVIKQWIGGSGVDILTLHRRLHDFYTSHNEASTLANAQYTTKIRWDTQDPIFAQVHFRVTRYALAETAPRLAHAREKIQQRRTAGTEFSACSGRYRQSLGLPCWHRLAELELDSHVLQATDFDPHWWIDRSQAPYVAPTQTPLEPRVILRQKRVKKTGAKGSNQRRDPSFFERVDTNNAASPPAAIPARMVTQPREQLTILPPPKLPVQHQALAQPAAPQLHQLPHAAQQFYQPPPPVVLYQPIAQPVLYQPTAQLVAQPPIAYGYAHNSLAIELQNGPPGARFNHPDRLAVAQQLPPPYNLPAQLNLQPNISGNGDARDWDPHYSRPSRSSYYAGHSFFG